MSLLSVEQTPLPEFSEVAERIAHRLCRDAVWAGDACNWLGWTKRPGHTGLQDVFATLDGSLYAGTAGVAWFLANYLRRRRSAVVERVLRGALRHALASTSRLPEGRCGLFDGIAGICLAALEAGTVLNDPALVEEARGRLESDVQTPTSDTTLDMIDGSAGMIMAQLAMASQLDSEPLLAAAVVQGDHLLAQADRTAAGWSWATMPGCADQNLTGYAHGTAGIAAALLELDHQTGLERFREAAHQAWRYERSHFSESAGNWPDFRLDEDQPVNGHAASPCFATAWCHGAVGIGLSRLRAWELGDQDEQVAAEIEAALARTLEWLDTEDGQHTEFSLCHGRAGSAELLLEAAHVLGRGELSEAAAAVGRQGIDQFPAQGRPWSCGGTRVGETPNLMLGLAGIGLFYLRLAGDRGVTTPLLIRPGAGRSQ